MNYTQALEILEALKDKESDIRLLSLLEKLGIEIPKDPTIDIHDLLHKNGHHELADKISKQIFNDAEYN